MLQGRVDAVEPLLPAVARGLHPLTYRSLADAQSFGYALLGPSFLFEFEGSKTPSLAPVGGLF